MSDTIGTGVIELAVGSSGVEAGLERIDSAVERSGRTLATLGNQGSAALDGIGNSGATVAARVDNTTRSLIGSVERATAALEAGKKSGADYFETLARNRGADLGQLAPYIAQLREVEAAQARATEALFSTRQAQDAVAEAARAEAAAQREAAQALSGRENFLAGLREQIALYGRSSEEVLRYRAAQAGVADDAAPLIAQLHNIRGAHEQVAAAARAEAQAQRDALQVQSGQNSFITGLEQQADAIGRTRSELLEMQAAQMGLTEQAAPFIARLREAEGAVDGAGQSAAQTSAALRNVPAQFTDIITSIQGGQEPLTVFLQQGGQLRDMFGSAGGAARALGGYVVGLINPFTVAAGAAAVLALAYNEGSKEVDAYNKALILSGNVAGTTAGQLADMARVISKTNGTQGDAAAALAALAATGKIGIANLQEYAQTAIDVQDALKQSVGDTAKEFADLAKAPLQSTERLNEKYNYLTAAVRRQIKALEDQGHTEAAGEVAQKAYKAAMDDRSKGITDSLGTIQTAVKVVGDSWKKFWDTALDVGREDSVAEKIGKLQKQISQREGDLYSFVGGSRESQAELQALRDKQALLQSGQREETKANELKAAGMKLEAARRVFDADGEKYLSRQTQLTNALTKAKNEGAAAGATQEAITTRLRNIEKEYADIFNDSIDSQIEGVKRRGAVEDIVAKRSLDQLNTNKAIGLVTEQSYMEQVAALELADFDRKKSQLQLELALTAKKQQSKKDQAAIEGQIAENEAAATSRQIQLTNDLYALQMKRDKDSFAPILESTASRNAMKETLAFEYAAYGKISDARELAMVSLRSELELKKQIAAAIAANKPLSDQEIARLRAEKDMHDEVARSTMAQGKAIEYAAQLSVENKRFAAEAIFDEKMRASALLQIDAATWQERIRLAGEGTEAQRLLQEQYLLWYQNQLAKPQIAAQREIWESINRTAHDTFVSIFDSGKSAFDRLTATLKNGLLDLLYQMTIKKWIFNIGASVSSAMVGGAAQAASGVGGAVGAAGSVSSIFNAVTGGPGILASAGGGLASMGATLGSGALESFGLGFSGQAASYAAAVGQSMNTAAALGSAFSAAIPWIAGATAAYKVWNTFFEAGPEANTRLQFASNNTPGNINNNERGESWNAPYIGNGSSSALGTFGVRQTFWGDATGEVVQSFLKTIGQTDDALAAFMTSTEKMAVSSYLTSKTFTANTGPEGSNPNANGELDKVFADRINNILEGLEPGLSALEAGFTGTSQALSVEAGALLQYRQALKDSNEAIFGVKVTLQEVAALKGATELTSAALARVTAEFTATNTVAQLFGKSSADAFGTVGLASEAARARLIAAAGGVDALASQTTSFAQNFMSDSERLAPTAKALGEAMGKLGLSSITTLQQFKEHVIGFRDANGQLVGGIDMATEAGAKEFASLMQLQGAFAQVAGAADAATAKALEKAKTDAKARADLEGQIFDMTHSTAEAVARQRQVELDAMDASLRPLQQRIYMLVDEKTAAQAAAEAVKKAQDAAAETTKANAAALQSLGNSMVETMKRAKDAGKSLDQFNQSLLTGDLSPMDAEGRYQAAKSQLMAADPGDTTAATTFLNAAKARDAGDFSYSRDFAMVQARIARAAEAQYSLADSIPETWRQISQNFISPGQIYSATAVPVADTSAMEVQMEKMSGKLETALATIASNTDKMASVLDMVTNGGSGMEIAP